MKIIKLRNIKIQKIKRDKEGRYYHYRINVPAQLFRHGLLRPGECFVIIIQKDKPEEEWPDIRIEGTTKGSVVYISWPPFRKEVRGNAEEA